MKASGYWDQHRAQQRLNWLDEQLQERLGQVFLAHQGVQELLAKEKGAVQSGTLSPGLLAKRLVDLFFSQE